MRLTFTPLDERAARTVLAWRYDAPCSFYNPDAAALGKDAQTRIDLRNRCYARTDEAVPLAA